VKAFQVARPLGVAKQIGGSPDFRSIKRINGRLATEPRLYERKKPRGEIPEKPSKREPDDIEEGKERSGNSSVGRRR
jgi:hypothetical protein